MGIGLVKGKSSIFVKEETTEGVYVAPASATEALEVLENGLEFSFTREAVSRNNLTSTIEEVASRVGMSNLTGSVSVEFKASSTAGNAPREAALYKSLLGDFKTSNASTTKTGNTSTVIQIEDADIGKYAANDIILIKQPSAFEMRPISAVDSTPSAANITLKFALDNGAPIDEVVIEKFTKYFHSEGAPTLSVTDYVGGEIEEKMAGIRCVKAALENYSTGKVSNWKFDVEGLSMVKVVNAPAFEPDFSNDALPPVLLDSCIWINGVEVDYTEFGLNVENTKAEVKSSCSESGKIASRFTNLAVSGTINPYMEDDDVARFELFNANNDIHIFGYAKNPTNTTGEGSNYVAFWIPQAKIENMPSADIDGIMIDQISFKSYRKLGGDSIFLAFV
jgi:hypothetical protein